MTEELSHERTTFISHPTDNEKGTRHNLMLRGDLFVGHYDITESGELANVYVAEAHCRQGNAAKLLEHALQQYRLMRTAPYLYCSVDNATAQRLYRRIGFRVTASDRAGYMRMVF